MRIQRLLPRTMVSALLLGGCGDDTSSASPASTGTGSDDSSGAPTETGSDDSSSAPTETGSDDSSGTDTESAPPSTTGCGLAIHDSETAPDPEESAACGADCLDVSTVPDCSMSSTSCVPSAFSQAVSEGKTRMYFPSGDYVVGGSCGGSTGAVVPPSITHIYGEGTLLQQSNEMISCNNILEIDDHSIGLLIDGLVFRGAAPSPSAASGLNAIRVRRSCNVKIRNAEFQNFRSPAVWFDGVRDSRLTQSTVHDSGHAVLITSSHFILIEDNLIKDTMIAPERFVIGIGLDSTEPYLDLGRLPNDVSTDVVIRENTVSGYPNTQAIMAHAGQQVTIACNRLRDVSLGVSLPTFNETDLMTDILVRGNVFEGMLSSPAPDVALFANYGINVGGAPGIPSHIDIFDNDVANANAVSRLPYEGGISIAYSQDVDVLGNRIHGAYASGIVMQYGSETQPAALDARIIQNHISAVLAVEVQQSGVFIRSPATGSVTANDVHGAAAAVSADSPHGMTLSGNTLVPDELASNGRRCDSDDQCESGFCYPGPDGHYCISAAANCARPNTAGVMFGDSYEYNCSAYRCDADVGLVAVGKANGVRCMSADECGSGFCYPGPNDHYCIAAAANCARPYYDGVMFGDTYVHRGREYQCALDATVFSLGIVDGYPCTSASECLSGSCSQGPDGHYCTAATADCARPYYEGVMLDTSYTYLNRKYECQTGAIVVCIDNCD